MVLEVGADDVAATLSPDARGAAIDAAAAEGLPVRYYDTWSQFMGSTERGSDGFHLNQAASRVLGDSLLVVVKEMLPL